MALEADTGTGNYSQYHAASAVLIKIILWSGTRQPGHGGHNYHSYCVLGSKYCYHSTVPKWRLSAVYYTAHCVFTGDGALLWTRSYTPRKPNEGRTNNVSVVDCIRDVLR